MDQGDFASSGNNYAIVLQAAGRTVTHRVFFILYISVCASVCEYSLISRTYRNTENLEPLGDQLKQASDEFVSVFQFSAGVGQTAYVQYMHTHTYCTHTSILLYPL